MGDNVLEIVLNTVQGQATNIHKQNWNKRTHSIRYYLRILYRNQNYFRKYR